MGIIFQDVDKLLTAYNTIMYLFSLSANFSSVLNTIGSHATKILNDKKIIIIIVNKI